MAVIHGGPGAAGEMAPVAREIVSCGGVLEPLQTAASLEGQVEELKTVLEKNAESPVTLIGFSWGAWLSFILAAKQPLLVKKLILIGSGPFEDQYAATIHEKRLSRLNEKERAEIKRLSAMLEKPALHNSSAVFAQLGALLSKADAYSPSFVKPESAIDYRPDIYRKVWNDAEELRRSGKLLEFGRHIKCEVVAIHGDYDPHPSEGVQRPLAAILHLFRFIVLRNCGHKPWIEQKAREEFFRILKEELEA